MTWGWCGQDEGSTLWLGNLRESRRKRGKELTEGVFTAFEDLWATLLVFLKVTETRHKECEIRLEIWIHFLQREREGSEHASQRRFLQDL